MTTDYIEISYTRRRSGYQGGERITFCVDNNLADGYIQHFCTASGSLKTKCSVDTMYNFIEEQIRDGWTYSKIED